MAFLRESQLDDGEFRTFIAADAAMAVEVQPDSSPFATAIVLYGLRFVALPASAEITRKATAFLLGEATPPGLWRYWTAKSHRKISPDVDDTAVVSHVLSRCAGPERLPHNREALLANRNAEGLFYTWIREAGAKNDIDSVVNANVLLYLGECPETEPVASYLERIIREDLERSSYWYYCNDLALYYAVSRACRNGVRRLAGVAPRITEKCLAARRPDGSFGDPLATALAVCALLNLGFSDRRVLQGGLRHLLAAQTESGSWPRSAYYTGPEPPLPLSSWFGSEELTTGIAIEALTRLGRFRAGA